MNSRQRRGVVLLVVSAVCAVAAFAGVLAQWRGAQAQVESALASLSQALGAAAAGYADAETTAARMFAR